MEVLILEALLVRKEEYQAYHKAAEGRLGRYDVMAQASCRGTCGCGVYVVDEIIGNRNSSIMMENADFGVIYDPWAFGMGRKVTNHAAFDCAIHR